MRREPGIDRRATIPVCPSLSLPSPPSFFRSCVWSRAARACTSNSRAARLGRHASTCIQFTPQPPPVPLQTHLVCMSFIQYSRWYSWCFWIVRDSEFLDSGFRKRVLAPSLSHASRAGCFRYSISFLVMRFCLFRRRWRFRECAGLHVLSPSGRPLIIPVLPQAVHSSHRLSTSSLCQSPTTFHLYALAIPHHHFPPLPLHRTSELAKDQFSHLPRSFLSH